MEDLIREFTNSIVTERDRIIMEELSKKSITLEDLQHSCCSMIEHTFPEGTFRQYIVNGEVVLCTKITSEVVVEEDNYIYREVMEIIK